jgi:hypothetical protein
MSVTLLAFMVLGSTAHAGAPDVGARLQAFLGSLEGDWSGGGTETALGADGSTIHTDFTVALTIDASGDADWTFTSNTETDSGATFNDASSLSVRDDTLFLTNNGVSVPVGQLPAGDGELAYEFQSYPNGVVLDTQVRFTLGQDGALSMHKTVTENSVTIADDQMTLNR